MENAQKWMALIATYLPQAMCLAILMTAFHGVYWHVELTKEFWGIVGLAAGFLLKSPSAPVAK